METANDIIKTVFATPWAQVVLICLVVGYIARVLPFLPNKYIFILTTIVGGVLFPYLCSPSIVSPEVRNPNVSLVIMGLTVGFAAWVFHKLVIKKIEDKFPSVSGFFEQFDNDAKKDPVPATPPAPK